MELAPAIAAWLHAHPDAFARSGAGGATDADRAAESPVDARVGLRVERLTGGGYSNEILLVTPPPDPAGGRARERLVVRLPPAGASLFPTYDLTVEVAAQRCAAAHGVPVPHPLVHEPDPSWLGTPFLVMPLVAGHSPGEVPAFDPWLADRSPDEQRTVHLGFLDTLATIHRAPWDSSGTAGALRDAGADLAVEVAWWSDLTAWIFDGDPPGALHDAFAWCLGHRPTDLPPASLLWGDVRLGNVLVGDDLAPVAVLDWEMASIGPAELDLAWCTALDTMTAHFAGQRVPGFLSRDEVVAHHEHRLGRSLVAFEWFEVFALCRSAALSIRTDRLESIRRGKPPRSLAGNALLAYVDAAIGAVAP